MTKAEFNLILCMIAFGLASVTFNLPWYVLTIGLMLFLVPIYILGKKTDNNLAENLRRETIERFIRGEKTCNETEMQDAVHIWSCVCPCSCRSCQYDPQCTNCRSSWGWSEEMKKIYGERSGIDVRRQQFIERLLQDRRASWYN